MLQIETAQQLVKLGRCEFDAPLAFGCHGQLKCAHLKTFVPDTKAILIPEQNLDAVSSATEKQEQVA
jgi:hypothetical protein